VQIVQRGGMPSPGQSQAFNGGLRHRCLRYSTGIQASYSGGEGSCGREKFYALVLVDNTDSPSSVYLRCHCVAFLDVLTVRLRRLLATASVSILNANRYKEFELAIFLNTEYASMNVGKPTVWIKRSSVCSISLSVAPAARALLMWVSRPDGGLLAPDIATLMSQRTFSGKARLGHGSVLPWLRGWR